MTYISTDRNAHTHTHSYTVHTLHTLISTFDSLTYERMELTPFPIPFSLVTHDGISTAVEKVSGSVTTTDCCIPLPMVFLMETIIV